MKALVALQKNLALLLALCLSLTAKAQLLNETFDSSASFTISDQNGPITFFSDGSGDYFGIYDGNGDGGANFGTNTNNPSGAPTYSSTSDNYIVGEDLDGEAPTAPLILTWSSIPLSGETCLKISADFASTRIDADDSIIVSYRLDGGGWVGVLGISGAPGTYNSPPYEITDFSTGAGDNTATQVNGTFTNLSKIINLAGTETTIELKAVFDSNNSSDNFAIDNIRILEVIPNIIYVNSNATIGGNGNSWETAFKYLQDALDVTTSGNGDQVWIAQGTYYPDDGANVTQGDRFASFIIKDEVALYGGFIGSETDLAQRDWESYPTTLSGEIWEDQIYWSIHVTTIDNNTVRFDGITITKGNANGSNNNTDRAAAVYGGGNVTVTNCTFLENSAANGGVAYGGTWTTSNCSFLGNSANTDTGSGGVAYESTWTTTDCIFSGNSARHGGVARLGAWTANNCTFSGNSTSTTNNSSGGVAYESTWTTTDCIFSGNFAYLGSVAYNGTWTATNSTFSGNSAYWSGGVAYGGTWTASNCTFLSNSADSSSFSRGGGVAYESTWTAINCTFSENSAGIYGGVARLGTWTTTNCTFSGNSCPSRGGVAYESTWTATNCTFSQNSAQFGSVAYLSTWKILNNIFHNNPNSFHSVTIHATNETTPTPFTVYANNLIQGGRAAFVNCTIPFPIPEANIIDADPFFVNYRGGLPIVDPDGPDDIWGTEDDGLRLQSSSPAIGLGDASFLPVDTYDLDGDDDTAESLPVDVAGYKRIQDTTLDLGAYEYGNVIGLSSVFTTSAVAATGGSVSPSGAIVSTEPTEITLTATANNGYVFGYWSGDVPEELEQENPLTVTVEEDGSITAVFLQDSLDSDGDGLSQYQEVIVYGTDPGDTDSDDDGFDDGFEVDTGYSPMSISSTPDAISGIETAVKYWFNAANGVNYRIEYSTDFENWYILEDNILGASDEIVRYYDTVGTQKRFYRAKRND